MRKARPAPQGANVADVLRGMGELPSGRPIDFRTTGWAGEQTEIGHDPAHAGFNAVDPQYLTQWGVERIIKFFRKKMVAREEPSSVRMFSYQYNGMTVLFVLRDYHEGFDVIAHDPDDNEVYRKVFGLDSIAPDVMTWIDGAVSDLSRAGARRPDPLETDANPPGLASEGTDVDRFWKHLGAAASLYEGASGVFSKIRSLLHKPGDEAEDKGLEAAKDAHGRLSQAIYNLNLASSEMTGRWFR